MQCALPSLHRKIGYRVDVNALAEDPLLLSSEHQLEIRNKLPRAGVLARHPCGSVAKRRARMRRLVHKTTEKVGIEVGPRAGVMQVHDQNVIREVPLVVSFDHVVGVQLRAIMRQFVLLEPVDKSHRAHLFFFDFFEDGGQIFEVPAVCHDDLSVPLLQRLL